MTNQEFFIYGAGVTFVVGLGLAALAPVRRELRKIIVGAIADFEKVKSPKGIIDFALNGLGNEYMKWFGHSDRVWDFMYKNCNYVEKMQDKSQQARYLRIKNLISELAPPSSAVLDVGCGTANGFAIWREAGIGSFEGIDIAKSAIVSARHSYADVPSARFTCTSMQEYDSEGRKFDVVIFNESLYYIASVAEAVAMATKAASLLKPRGHLVISMSETHHAQKIWDALLQVLPPPRLKSQARAPEGNTWQVEAIQCES